MQTLSERLGMWRWDLLGAGVSTEQLNRLHDRLVEVYARAEAGPGGCEWLSEYCRFLQQRHRLPAIG
jgi:hypothetical protein